MRLCCAHRKGKPFIGLAKGESWLNLSQVMHSQLQRFPWLTLCPEPTMVELLANTPDLLCVLTELYSQLESSDTIQRYTVQGEMQLLAPLPRPSKIIALGRNYAAHAAETGSPVPQEPILFAKAPSSIIASGSDIVYPDYVQRLDPEIELGVVIGRKAKQIPVEQAMSYVAGYTIVNDVTARDMQKNAIERGYPWFLSKSLDTFCPMGPYLVLSDEIQDPHNLELTLRVNGEIRQQSNTSMCIFRIPQLIAYISKHMTLEPGDVIATGTPQGIAPLQRGDIVECSIHGLGTLTNRVV